MPTTSLAAIAAGALPSVADAAELADALHAETIAAVRERFGASAAKGDNWSNGWKRGSPPVGAVVHVPALAGRSALDGLDLCRRFTRKGAQASTHVVIDYPSGEILLCVPVGHRSWHAGKPWNHSHFGIDIVSPGPVRRKGGEAGTGWLVPHRDRNGKRHEVLLPDGAPLPDEDVVDFGGTKGSERPWRLRYWHAPTPAQVRSLGVTLRLLRLLHPDTLDPSSVVRHADIAPGRRVDPGPCVPLEQVREWGWSCEDITQSLDGLSGDEWHEWLRSQWSNPTGLVTAADRTLPGRPVG